MRQDIMGFKKKKQTTTRIITERKDAQANSEEDQGRDVRGVHELVTMQKFFS
jgi:hypothetical protein